MELRIIGPDINLLSKREEKGYCDIGFKTFFVLLKVRFCSITILRFRFDAEGKILDKFHKAEFPCYGTILNAEGYAHTYVAKEIQHFVNSSVRISTA